MIHVDTKSYAEGFTERVDVEIRGRRIRCYAAPRDLPAADESIRLRVYVPSERRYLEAIMTAAVTGERVWIVGAANSTMTIVGWASERAGNCVTRIDVFLDAIARGAEAS